MQVQTKIAEYLANNGIKKCHVAKKAGIKDYRFSLIIHNRTAMRADEFEAICMALGVSPELFMQCKAE